MPAFTYTVGQERGFMVVGDELAPYYRAQPGYVEVITEEAAAELAGDDLDAAVKAAHIERPSSLRADEKRAALVAATDPDNQEN